VSPCPTFTLTPTLTRTPTITLTPTTTPSATHTLTTTPTETGTSRPTLTPRTTPTPCVNRSPFQDLSSRDYFYSPVMYLYCRRVISGYPDDTFKPYNNVTRAQLCKMLVLS